MKKMAVVMSGGVLSGGEIPKHVKTRCDYLINNQADFQFAVVSSSYSLNIPPKLSIEGYPLSESSAGYHYLKKNGFELELFCEQFSHDTVLSVFFCLDIFSNSLNATEVVFITSDFHSERVRVISNFLKEILNLVNLKITVIGCFEDEVPEARKSREADSINAFLQEFKGVKDRAEFLIRILKNHSNYNYKYIGSNLTGFQLLY